MRSIVRGTVTSAAEVMLLSFGRVLVKRGRNRMEAFCMGQ